VAVAPLLHHQAAVDGENLARDVRGFVRGEESHGVGDVLDRAKVAKGRRGLDLILQGFGQVLGQLGDDEARGYGG
jgi:hypothetical protein